MTQAEQRAFAARDEALASLAAAAQATEQRLQGQLLEASSRSDTLQQQMSKLEEQVSPAPPARHASLARGGFGITQRSVK